MKLKRNHPARRATESMATYWDKPGAAITELHESLLRAGVRISDPVISFNDRKEDRKLYGLEDAETGDEVENSMLVFAWYWISDTRCEVVSYLS